MSGITRSLRDKFLWEDLTNSERQVVTFSFIPCKNWQPITTSVCGERGGTCTDKIVQTNYKFQPNSVQTALDIPTHLFTYENDSQVFKYNHCAE